MANEMAWVDKVEQEQQEERSKEYFNLVEGDNRFQLLTHCAPLAQRWTGQKYEVLVEGDSQEGKSIKGVCWVLQDGIIKFAKLPYTVVKQIRAFQTDPDYAFEEFPMPRMINVKAKGAGTKEVEYTVIPSPKETKVDQKIMDELHKNKLPPEEMIEKMKEKRKVKQPESTGTDYAGKDYPEATGEVAF